ncbi:MAG: bifunctional folylpolyglutamate synthase/dihydrofolate synthase [Candidatus Nanopelagicaceae bacterium]
MSENVDVRLAQIVEELNSRWPENKIEPSLDRIRTLLDYLGNPQETFRSIHLAGTNGKTSTSRMIDSLLRSFGIRTGRYTSPHLEDIRERITIDGDLITPEYFIYTYDDIKPYIDLVDANSEHPLSYFEVLTAMAYAAFADAPIDVGVIECGVGGAWDATNVINSDVAVMTPIGLDHQEYLGNTIAEIAHTKAGIFREGKPSVLAHQTREAAEVLIRESAKSESIPLREGLDFALLRRDVAVGGQLLSIQGLGGTYDDIFLPLYGRHQASNATLALVAVEAFLGGGAERLDVDAIRDGFAQASSPGRLEVMRRNPTVIIDAAHNHHGAVALHESLSEEFAFDRIVAVVAILADKDAVSFLSELSNIVDEIIVTENNSPRAMPTEDLFKIAVDIFEEDRVSSAGSIAGAIEAAMDKASHPAQSIGIVITGSVITVGQARALLKRGGNS